MNVLKIVVFLFIVIACAGIWIKIRFEYGRWYQVVNRDDKVFECFKRMNSNKSFRNPAKFFDRNFHRRFASFMGSFERMIPSKFELCFKGYQAATRQRRVHLHVLHLISCKWAKLSVCNYSSLNKTRKQFEAKLTISTWPWKGGTQTKRF